MTIHIPAAALWFLGGIGCVGLAWLLWAFAMLAAFAWQSDWPKREARRRARRAKRQRDRG